MSLGLNMVADLAHVIGSDPGASVPAAVGQPRRAAAGQLQFRPTHRSRESGASSGLGGAAVGARPQPRDRAGSRFSVQ